MFNSTLAQTSSEPEKGPFVDYLFFESRLYGDVLLGVATLSLGSKGLGLRAFV